MVAVADEVGIERLGRIVVDSTKIRANVSPESVVKQSEFSEVRAEFQRILKKAEAVDQRETESSCETRLSKEVKPDQMRESAGVSGNLPKSVATYLNVTVYQNLR